jgi:hypothetical protein
LITEVDRSPCGFSNEALLFDHYLHFYPNNIYKTNLVTSTEKLFPESGGVIEHTTSYEYNEKNMKNKVIQSTSDKLGTTPVNQETQYTYGYEEDALKTTMLAANMLEYPSQTIVRKAGKKVSAQQTVYKLENNLIVPAYENKMLTNNEQYETNIVYDKYDTKGNVLQYHDKSGLNVSFLWGYNFQYPIAEFKNATYTQVTS